MGRRGYMQFGKEYCVHRRKYSLGFGPSGLVSFLVKKEADMMVPNKIGSSLMATMFLHSSTASSLVLHRAPPNSAGVCKFYKVSALSSTTVSKVPQLSTQ